MQSKALLLLTRFMPRGDPSEYICESLVSYPDSNRKKRESEKKNSTRDKKRV